MESELAAAHPEIGTWSGRLARPPRHHDRARRDADGLPRLGARRQRPGRVARRPRVQQARHHHAPQLLPRRRRRAPTPTGSSSARRAASTARSASGQVRAKRGAKVVQQVYRLALTSDPSYAAYFGTENVLAEKVTLINRVNQIYNDDLAITMRLVNATDKLNLDTTAKALGADGPCGAHACFDQVANPADPPADQYSQLDFCDIGTLGRNRTVLGQLVGASNYDVGHIGLGVNGGGIAFLGVVGWDYKGSGCTGLPAAAGRLLRDRLRRARARPPVRRQPHLQRRAVRLLGRQPRARHLGRARLGLVGDGVRRHLPAGRPAAAHRPVLQPAHQRRGQRLHRHADAAR